MIPAVLVVLAASFPVTIRVDAGRAQGALVPIWRFFGADEPNYAYMKDGRKLLRALGELEPKAVYFRTHNLLNTGDGTPALKWGSTNAYTEDARGRPIYDWTVIDRIFDSYLERGVRPYVEIGFMPRALSTRPDPYQHEWRPGLPYDDVFTGWAYPPSDDSKWEELVYRWVRHCVERYGKAEVATWYWETWNEANIGYWQGTPEEFLKLHERTIAAVRRALPEARVGGPDMAGSDPEFLRSFLEHCIGNGTPLDFVAFHAKGAPTYVDGHVRMGIAAHLATIDRGFATIASFPRLKRTPIVIGESDPEGCAACQGPPLAYRSGTMYSSYTAASFARKHDLAARHGVRLEGALTWAFEFEDQPYFAGFRALASNGIALPALNVFRMFSKMGGERVSAESSAEVPLATMLTEGVRGAADVSARAGLEAKRLAIMAWHYHDDDVPGPVAAVELAVRGLPAGLREARLTHYRIDEHHSNAYAAWKRMGSPIAPNRDQYGELEAASSLARLDEPRRVRVEAGTLARRCPRARPSGSLVALEREKARNDGPSLTSPSTEVYRTPASILLTGGHDVQEGGLPREVHPGCRGHERIARPDRPAGQAGADPGLAHGEREAAPVCGVDGNARAIPIELFRGECCESELGRLSAALARTHADVLVGVGGGKTIDTAKIAADRAGLPVVVVPTIASTDAPTSGCAVIYTEEGVFVSVCYQRMNPAAVLVDLGVIAAAPTRFLVAGMGDALSTWFEARTCERTHSPNECGGHGTAAGFAVARLCYETLLSHGAAARRDNDSHLVTPALDRIVEANILLSGIGFESAGLATAHSVHNGLTALAETHSSYHGEKVAFGVLTGLHLTDASADETATVFSFCEEVGLPTTLADIGLGTADRRRLMLAAEKACAPDQPIHHEATVVTPAAVVDAMLSADALGRERRSRGQSRGAGDRQAELQGARS